MWTSMSASTSCAERLAHQALEQIGELFKVESEIMGRSPLRRRRVRGCERVQCSMI
jgi:hypothetical protein